MADPTGDPIKIGRRVYRFQRLAEGEQWPGIDAPAIPGGLGLLWDAQGLPRLVYRQPNGAVVILSANAKPWTHEQETTALAELIRD